MKILIIFAIIIINSIYLLTATKKLLSNKIKIKEDIVKLNFKHEIHSVCVLAELINAGISPKLAIDECISVLPGELVEKFKKQELSANFLTSCMDLVLQSSYSGMKIVESLRLNISTFQRQHKFKVLKQIKKVEVLLLAPLGFCFLPVFMLIAIVPLIGSLIGGFVN